MSACEHTCCPYSHLRRPAISRGQCECRCHDGRCENAASHVGECNCPGDYYQWPHHMTTCPKGLAIHPPRGGSTSGAASHSTTSSRASRREPVMGDEARERLGRRVREVWVLWAQEQSNPKLSWLVPWDDLSEHDKEADRRIGSALWGDGFADGVNGLQRGVEALRPTATTAAREALRARMVPIEATGWNAYSKTELLNDFEAAVRAPLEQQLRDLEMALQEIIIIDAERESFEDAPRCLEGAAMVARAALTAADEAQDPDLDHHDHVGANAPGAVSSATEGLLEGDA